MRYPAAARGGAVTSHFLHHHLKVCRLAIALKKKNVVTRTPTISFICLVKKRIEGFIF